MQFQNKPAQQVTIKAIIAMSQVTATFRLSAYEYLCFRYACSDITRKQLRDQTRLKLGVSDADDLTIDRMQSLAKAIFYIRDQDGDWAYNNCQGPLVVKQAEELKL